MIEEFITYIYAMYQMYSTCNPPLSPDPCEPLKSSCFTGKQRNPYILELMNSAVKLCRKAEKDEKLRGLLEKFWVSTVYRGFALIEDETTFMTRPVRPVFYIDVDEIDAVMLSVRPYSTSWEHSLIMMYVEHRDPLIRGFYTMKVGETRNLIGIQRASVRIRNLRLLPAFRRARRKNTTRIDKKHNLSDEAILDRLITAHFSPGAVARIVKGEAPFDIYQMIIADTYRKSYSVFWPAVTVVKPVRLYRPEMHYGAAILLANLSDMKVYLWVDSVYSREIELAIKNREFLRVLLMIDIRWLKDIEKEGKYIDAFLPVRISEKNLDREGYRTRIDIVRPLRKDDAETMPPMIWQVLRHEKKRNHGEIREDT